MKKCIALFLSVVVFLLFNTVSSAESPAPVLGKVSEFLAPVDVYCKHWNETYGKDFGTDVSYHSDVYTLIHSSMVGFGGDMDIMVIDNDGIIAETDWGRGVYSLRACLISDAISEDDATQAKSICRIAALVSAIAFDYPDYQSEMDSRLTNVADTVFAKVNPLLNTVVTEGSASFTISTHKGDYTFDILLMEDGIYISYGTVLYPHNIPD